MAIKLTTTKEAATLHGLKCLVHGPAGAGKTTLAKTAGPGTIIISAEAGLLSLRDSDIPVIEVKTLDDIKEAYSYVLEQNGSINWIILDSISEIAETVLASEKAHAKDARQAYGALQDSMMQLMKAFRDISGKNVVFTAKQEYIKDDVGVSTYKPMMPGQKLAQQIPYLFDLVFALRVEPDADNNMIRYLQTGRDLQYDAKDRSGVLDMYEPPDLTHIANKILNSKPTLKEAKKHG